MSKLHDKGNHTLTKIDRAWPMDNDSPRKGEKGKKGRNKTETETSRAARTKKRITASPQLTRMRSKCCMGRRHDLYFFPFTILSI